MVYVDYYSLIYSFKFVYWVVYSYRQVQDDGEEKGGGNEVRFI